MGLPLGLTSAVSCVTGVAWTCSSSVKNSPQLVKVQLDALEVFQVVAYEPNLLEECGLVRLVSLLPSFPC